MSTKEYIFDKSLSKRPCIYIREGNTLYPVLYFQKAKYASDEDFNDLLKVLIPSKKGSEE